MKLLEVLYCCTVVEGSSVSDYLRLSYRGVLVEAVCIHMSFYLHRLWPYIK